MSEWISTAPHELPREVREVDGVLESSLTPEAEVLHRQHLDLEKQRRVEAYYAGLMRAVGNLDVIESSEQRLAAD